MSSHNQVEVNSVDQYVWREQRTKIYTRLQKLAESQGCDYIPVRQTISHEQKFCDEIMSSRKTKILTSCFGDIIPSMGTLVDLDKKCQSHGKKLWLLTDNLVDSTKYNFSNIDIRPVPQLLGPYASIRDQSDPVASHGRLFNCFIQRCESVRQSWFYHLWLENLLEKGYVSYLLLQMRGYSKLTGMDLFDAIHHSQGLDTLPKFQIAHEKLRTVVPYRNFEENFDLMTYINDSKYSVVLETFAVEDNHGAWCVTEKPCDPCSQTA